MSSALTYKGYTGTIEVDLESNCLHGKIIGISDCVVYQANTVHEVRQVFETAVIDYLDTCAEVGKIPAKPQEQKLREFEIDGEYFIFKTPECEECALGHKDNEACGIPQAAVDAMLMIDGTCVRCGHNPECHAIAPPPNHKGE